MASSPADSVQCRSNQHLATKEKTQGKGRKEERVIKERSRGPFAQWRGVRDFDLFLGALSAACSKAVQGDEKYPF